MPLNINNIPDDVLRLIFEIRSSTAKRGTQLSCTPLKENSFKASDLESEESSALILAAVNQKLRGVALTTPALWSTIHDKMTREQYLCFLQRSGQAPLTVVVRRLCPGEGVDEAQDRFLFAVLAKKDQWQALYVAAPRGHVGKERFQFAGQTVTYFPILSSISITDGQVSESDSFTKRFKMDRHNFIQHWSLPALEDAFFHSILPNGPFLSSLKSLEVELHGRYKEPQDIWGVLSTCGSLQNLSIGLEDWEHHDRAPPEQAVTLASVESFELRVTSSSFTAAFWIIQAFRCPQLRSLFISLEDAPGGKPDDWLRTIFLEGGVGHVDGLEEIYINFGDDLAPSPTGLSVIESFFRKSAEWTFDRLSCLTIGQATLQNLLFQRRVHARPAMVKLEQFPRTMEVLDISKILEVDSIALNELIKRLCEASSRATLRVEKESVRHKKESTAFAVDLVSRYCEQEKKDGHMNFEVEWVNRQKRCTCGEDHNN